MAQFLSGNEYYNATALAVGGVGVILGVIALWIAVAQISRIAKAADAAQAAAQDARKRVIEIATLSELMELSTLAREALTYIDSTRFGDARLRALDLRNSLVKSRASLAEPTAARDEDWQWMITKAATVQEAIEKHSENAEGKLPNSRKWRSLIQSVLDKLNGYAANHTVKLGGLDGNR